MLAGLGYALINAELPRRLWTRGSALVSAMWGVATMVGPAMGGLFAQFGLWRWAFGALTILTVVMAILVPRARSGAAPSLKRETSRHRMPIWSLLLMGAAALAVSVAQIPHNLVATGGLLAAGVLLVAVFVVVDWRAHAAVLRPSYFAAGR